MHATPIRITLTFLVATCLPLAACGKDEGGTAASGGASGGEGAPSAAKGAPASGPDYAPIDAMVASAKTGDDFTNVLMACGKLEIEAAAGGNGELAKDATYREHCRLAPAKKRAELAIAESTPDKMSVHCLSASMGLEGLIEDGIAADEARELHGKVNTSCGL